VVVESGSPPALVDGVMIGSEPKFELKTRTDLFAERANVRDAIRVAFGAFLPPLPE
jgi:hypothetical protein